MSTLYKIRWSTVAEDDLRKIITYIARDNTTHAKNIFERIKKKSTDLKQFTDRGRIVPELQYFGITLYREIIVSPWRIIYNITNDVVYVLSVIDSRRNVEDILMSRFIKELHTC